MIALMYGARSRVALTAPYVIPSAAFLAAMCSAARRGVEVDLIVDRTSNKPLVQLAQQSYYDEMLAAGVCIHRHGGSFLHAKHMSIDADIALIGSSNLDIRSFALNAEVSVLIYDPGVVADLAAEQARYLRQAERVTRETRSRIGFGRRTLENLARLTDSVLRPRPARTGRPVSRGAAACWGAGTTARACRRAGTAAPAVFDGGQVGAAVFGGG